MQLAEKTFLVVDDEPDILDAIKRLFRRQYRVLTAQTAEEAFELLASEPVQVVMTDQRMPRTSGVEFLTELRQRYPDVVRVLLTGYSNIDNIVDAINEGHVYRYISKPWNPSELKLFVAQAFDHYSAQRERQQLVSELQDANRKLEQQNAMLTKVNEELTMLDRMKTVFMEVVSHELNTPIAVLLGYSFLLNRELGDTDNKVVEKAMAGVEGAGNRLKNITSRIFKMMETESQTRHLDLSTVDVAAFFDQLLDQVEPFLEKREQTIRLDIEHGVTFEADLDKLNDIFINLVMNAVKFSYDGAEIVIEARPSPGDRVEVRVVDFGIGITDEDLEQVFDAFFSTFESRYHSSGEFEFGKRGIGLGLSVAKKFTEMHGGSISVTSEEGKGSVFSVTLPRRPAEISKRRDGSSRPVLN